MEWQSMANPSQWLAVSDRDADPPTARYVVALVGLVVCGFAAFLAAFGGLNVAAAVLGLFAAIGALDLFVLSPDARRGTDAGR